MKLIVGALAVVLLAGDMLLAKAPIARLFCKDAQ